MKVHLLKVAWPAALMLVFVAGVAQADIIPPATITLTADAAELVTSGNGYADMRIESMVTQTGNRFLYEYWITSNESDGQDGYLPLGKDISHVLIEVSENADSIDDIIIDGTLETSAGVDPEFGDATSANGNPGLPGTIHGIRLDLTEDTDFFHFSFESYRVPVLGSLYVKGGSDPPPQGGADNYAYNTGQNGGQDFFIVPDSRTVVPEPATMTLLGLGIAGMAISRLRRKPTS